MGFHHVGQAGLELLTSGDPPTSASQSARIIGMGFHHVGQAGLELLTSGDPPTSASQSARITGLHHGTLGEKAPPPALRCTDAGKSISAARVPHADVHSGASEQARGSRSRCRGACSGSVGKAPPPPGPGQRETRRAAAVARPGEGGSRRPPAPPLPPAAPPRLAMVEQGDAAPLLRWAEGPAVSLPQAPEPQAGGWGRGGGGGARPTAEPPRRREPEEPAAPEVLLQPGRLELGDVEEDQVVAVFVVTFDPRSGEGRAGAGAAGRARMPPSFGGAGEGLAARAPALPAPHSRRSRAPRLWEGRGAARPHLPPSGCSPVRERGLSERPRALCSSPADPAPLL
ncbi:DENN domain-containing protein 11 [Plecturocebus cupreus]